MAQAPPRAPKPVLSEDEVKRLLRRGMTYTEKCRLLDEQRAQQVGARTHVYRKLREAKVPAERIAQAWGLSRQRLDQIDRETPEEIPGMKTRVTPGPVQSPSRSRS